VQQAQSLNKRSQPRSAVRDLLLPQH
jgi:hypothetical protein